MNRDFPFTAPLALAALSLFVLLHLRLGVDIGAGRLAELVTGAAPAGFSDIQATHAVLPRIVMGTLVGIALGIAGSLFQQMTGNRLASPLTLGASSGAWLAMIVATFLAPELAASAREWVSLAGATAAFGLLVAIAGLRGLMGLRGVLAGMAVNLLLGAVASAIILLQSPYFGQLFIWGAGDLAQNGWDDIGWAWPRLGCAILAAIACTRVLGLLRLGAGGAEGRGLALPPWLGLLALLALFLTAVSVASVGMIGFIGLLAPNIAGLGKARGPLREMLMSGLIGAALLVGADLIAVSASTLLRDMVPTGAAAALAGAPALILLLRRRLGAAGHAALEMPTGPMRIAPRTRLGICMLVLGTCFCALCLSPGASGWAVAWPDPLTLSFRWPRILGASGAGAAMAVSGMILQRVIRNPLASPDILGMSSGATFALVATALVTGNSIHALGIAVALLGSLVVLAALILLGRRHGHAPMFVALLGISLGALLDALVKIAMAAGTADSVAILGWLNGSTYRISPLGALALIGAASAALALSFAARRWLDLIGMGDVVATARGLETTRVRLLGLCLAASLAGIVTAIMGPISFVGLLAPHLATALGARRAGSQVSLGALLGACLLVLSDWLGRSLVYPMQLPAGTFAAILGGGYLLVLMIRARRAKP
ncbi:Fe(3+)-hydroxamate ABC transporter permease FhuB [Sulfitobacter aestuarii]|uniref:Fe(3+)-hydroxamate ABC transporter permease FhuB n=1 Tax=Sulfitobacter aestuarii TaxID=2161676 RepID=A0ABW5U539_9RHOB